MDEQLNNKLPAEPDVFISYSTKNKDIADAIVKKLEEGGIACWYAPRNIEPGQEWVSAIRDALNAAKVFVLILTDESNGSRQVMNEVALAFNAAKIMVPVRLTDAEMNAELEYYLTRVHWMDGTNIHFGECLELLQKQVASILQNQENVTAAPHPAAVGHSRHTSVTYLDKKTKILFGIGIAVLAVLCIGLGILLGKGKNAKSEKEGLGTVESQGREVARAEDGTKQNSLGTEGGQGQNSQGSTDEKGQGSQGSESQQGQTSQGSGNEQGTDEQGQGSTSGQQGQISQGQDDPTEPSEERTEASQKLSPDMIKEKADDSYSQGDFEQAYMGYQQLDVMGAATSDVYLTLGRMSMAGQGTQFDDLTTLQWYADAYDKGANLTASELYYLSKEGYYAGGLLPEDLDKAFIVCEECIVKGGDGTAMALIGQMYYAGMGTDTDYDEAAFWLGSALDAGGLSQHDEDFCYAAIGFMYRNGYISYEDVSKWLR